MTVLCMHFFCCFHTLPFILSEKKKTGYSYDRGSYDYYYLFIKLNADIVKKKATLGNSGV